MKIHFREHLLRRLPASSVAGESLRGVRRFAVQLRIVSGFTSHMPCVLPRDFELSES